MMPVTLFVEFDTQCLLLKALLPLEYDDIEIINANGQSSAITRAGTRLALKQQPTIVLLNTQTVDTTQSYELEQSVRYLVGRTETPYKILLAVPELEILLTFDKSVLEHLMGRSLSDAEFQLAQVTPRQFLSGSSTPNWEIAPLLAKLGTEQIASIRQHTLIQALLTFLAEVTARVGE